jgi:hypothetical protein
MTLIKTRIRVDPDGTLSGRADGLPVGEHDAEITLLDFAGARGDLAVAELLARVHAIQAEVGRLPVLDRRSPEEIIGYNQHGHLD